MALRNNQYIKVLQDNGCPDEIIADIVDSRVDYLLDSTRGAKFWLPMTYELGRVHQKGMKHLVDVLHWILHHINGYSVSEVTFDKEGNVIITFEGTRGNLIKVIQTVGRHIKEGRSIPKN